MTERTAEVRRGRDRRVGRRGFSFAEVLFAVIILGVGFILVAAIFPVAIQQTQSTGEDAAAAAAARQAGNVVSGLAGSYPNPLYDATVAIAPQASAPFLPNPVAANVRTLDLFPPTVKNYVMPATPPDPTLVGTAAPPPAIVVPFTGPRWDAVRDNVILKSDPRYAYVPFYRRENGSPIAQLIVVAVAVRNQPTYMAYQKLQTISPPPPIYQSDLLPPPVTTPSANVTLTRASPPAPASVTQVEICPDTVSFAAPPSWLVEGSYLPANYNPGGAASATARSYRLGRQIIGGAATTYELDPADDMKLAPGVDRTWGTADDIGDAATGGSIVTTIAPVPTATLQPVAAYASVYSVAGSVTGRITLCADLAHATGTATPNVAPGCAVQGAFVIVADDFPYVATNSSTYLLPYNKTPAHPKLVVGALNGRIMRLGAPVPADASATPPVLPGTFELDAQYPGPPPLETTNSYAIPIVNGAGGSLARVYLVGAGRTDSTGAVGNNVNATTNYTGPAQDIGVYTTYFTVP